LAGRNDGGKALRWSERIDGFGWQRRQDDVRRPQRHDEREQGETDVIVAVGARHGREYRMGEVSEKGEHRFVWARPPPGALRAPTSPQVGGGLRFSGRGAAQEKREEVCGYRIPSSPMFAW